MTPPGPVTPDSGDELAAAFITAAGWDATPTAMVFVARGLAAVRPLIEAGAAAKWAAEIREGAAIYATGARLGLSLGDAAPLPVPLAAYHRGMTDVAARIERGETP